MDAFEILSWIHFVSVPNKRNIFLYSNIVIEIQQMRSIIFLKHVWAIKPRFKKVLFAIFLIWPLKHSLQPNLKSNTEVHKRFNRFYMYIIQLINNTGFTYVEGITAFGRQPSGRQTTQPTAVGPNKL